MENIKKLQNKGTHLFYQFIIILFIVFLLSASLVINALADHAGDALEFDGGGEYVLLGDTGNLMGVSSWTSAKSVSLWLKPGMDAAPATHPTSGEMILGVDYPSLFGINRAVFNGQDRIWVWNADNNGVDMVSIPYTAGEWQHIALVHADGVLSAYLNGELVGIKVSGSTYAPGNGRVYLGGSGRSGTTRYFDGQIDEVRVWNIGLGSTEISAWRDQELNNSHQNWSNLAAYYQMSDGVGVVLTDNSGNGKDGALNGGMGDGNWVASGAFGHAGATTTPTEVMTTLTPTPQLTSTAVPPTLTSTPDVPTATPIDPTVTPVDPLATPLPPTSTNTPGVPTATLAPPTPTLIAPTATPMPPTATSAPPTLTSTPVVGISYAVEFDGVTEYVGLGDTGDLIGAPGWTSEKSISLWLKPGMSAAPATQFTAGELIFGVDYPTLFGINRANYNGLDRIWVWNADNNGIDSIGIPYTAGEWMHVAMVHTGNQLNTYLNGNLIGSTASGPTNAPRNGRTYIGGSGRSVTTRYFDGQIDEVRVWNIGLGSAEIGAWWDQELNNSHPFWTNLAAYFQMTNGAGVLLTDNSGNGRDGNLYGGMGDSNWVASGAFGVTVVSPTPTGIVATLPPTVTPLPSATPTATAIPPTLTSTSAGPTATLLPTETPLSPTATLLPSSTPTSTTVPPTPTPTPAVGSGYALEFDGNSDFVELHQTAYMMNAGWETTKTVSLWVKPIGLGEDCLYNDVAFCDTIFGDRPKWWGITRGVLDGFDRIWIWNAAGSTTYLIDRIGVEYTPDEWVHIALVHYDGVLIVYKNGVEVGNTLSGATQQPNTGAFPRLHLGGIINNTRANTTFRGIIDEVQIWSLAQSESQVAAGMYQILSGSEVGLSAYYRMSNGSGAILNDDSINAWNGVLIDGARGVPPDGGTPQWVSPGPF